jgi:acyl dehydratase
MRSLWRSLLSLRKRGRSPLEQTLTAAFVAPAADLAAFPRYAEALGFDPELGVPLSYLYLLAQRAHLHMMLGSDFPYPLAGMVHAAESLSALGSIDTRLNMAIVVKLRPEAPTRSGARLLTLETEYLQAERVVAQTQSRYLARRGTGSGKAGGAVVQTDSDAPPEIARYDLPAGAGRDYARISGDYNPIHLWPWSARLLGFRRPIIHGMHSLGRTLALLQRHHGNPIARIEARFSAPIALPAEVVLHADGQDFELRSGGKCAVTGNCQLEP